jgi:ribonucleoside-diphosphate reductase alpha chain
MNTSTDKDEAATAMQDEFVPTGFSLKIFKDRYAFTEKETWQEACQRVAHQMAIAETPEKQKPYLDKFYSILSANLFVPGGRIWYNSGRTNPQLLNCFVLDPAKDSKEGWGKSASNMIITSMTGGGCGDDFSDVRPRGAPISGQKGVAPGAVELMRLIDGCAKPVRNGGQRRVALMFSLDLDHPDIEEFLSAKLTKGELTFANVSVRSKDTKAFIKAIKNDADWELSWKGKYKRVVKARDIWNTIVKNAYNSAEPGLLNWELVESESNIYYIEPLVTTNPCGEIALSAYDCCCLGHLVLTRFINNDSIDYALLGNTIRTAVRFLDNVLTVNSYPLPEMKAKSQNLRRIGLGTTALADTLAILGLKYGSEEGNKFIDKLYRFISKVAYESSVMLAVEKGAFPLCDPSKHAESGFMKRMPEKIKSLVREHGIRNCAILTQAPTGTVSILSGNCSSGIEPIFAPAYERRYWDGEERKTELVFHPLFEQFMKEGKDVSHFIAARDLAVRDHMEVQKIVQRHVDNAVSKTINIAHDYPIEEVEKAWLEYLPYLKGTTFYRENTRGFVMADGTVELPPLSAIPLEEAKRRFSEEHKVDAAEVDDCASGLCTI